MSMETVTPAGEDGARPVLRREFSAEITPGVGRTVDVRVVPYGEQIEHNDGLGHVPVGVVYREEYLPGVFSHQLNAANRVLVNVEHEKGFAGIVGHGVELREQPDGFHGSFKLHDTAEGNKALTLVREGVFDSVSLEAVPVKDKLAPNGLVQRMKAHLRGIALTRFAAFEGARILALREEMTATLDERLLPFEMDPELVERCRQAGLKLPQRYEAHPDDDGHPGEAGTPELGTRSTDTTNQVEVP